jgi:hypothetical protein
VQHASDIALIEKLGNEAFEAFLGNEDWKCKQRLEMKHFSTSVYEAVVVIFLFVETRKDYFISRGRYLGLWWRSCQNKRLTSGIVCPILAADP